MNVATINALKQLSRKNKSVIRLWFRWIKFWYNCCLCAFSFTTTPYLNSLNLQFHVIFSGSFSIFSFLPAIPIPTIAYFFAGVQQGRSTFGSAKKLKIYNLYTKKFLIIFGLHNFIIMVMTVLLQCIKQTPIYIILIDRPYCIAYDLEVHVTYAITSYVQNKHDIVVYQYIAQPMFVKGYFWFS